MRYVRPSSFAMMKALDPKLMSQSAIAPPAAAPKAKKPSRREVMKPSRREVMNLLVTESNKTTVLGHLHPRRLRKDYEA